MPDVLARLLIEQENGFSAGQCPPLEKLIERLPAESRSHDNLLALICNEVGLRLRSNQQPTLAEYQQRFPHLSEALAIQWQIDQWLAEGFSTTLLGGVHGSLDSSLLTSHVEHSTASLSHDVHQPNSSESTEQPKIKAIAPIELAQHARYRLIRQIGRGGMGTVWLAMHIVMNRPVALKVIRPDLLSKAGALARFRREVQAAAKLHHPNVVTAYDAEQVGNTHFLVVEYIDGQTLSSQVAQGPLSIRDACQAIRDAARGLGHAHRSGLVHRDVKPGNLIRDSAGIIKVLDFGLVVDPSDESSITGENMVMGTPDYVAPEQALRPSEADARSDIYSLGCTLYHLLRGKAPFSGLTMLGKLDAHRYATPEPIVGLPDQLQSIVARMMAKRPEDRFQSAEEVMIALQPFCDDAETHTNLKTESDNKPWGRRALIGTASAVAAIGLIEGTRRWIGWPANGDRKSKYERVYETADKGQWPLPPASDPQLDVLPNSTRHALRQPESFGDGSAKDLIIQDKLMRLQAIDYPQLWLNYSEYPATDLNLRAHVRISEALENAVFKLVFMADSVGDYALQIFPRLLEVRLDAIPVNEQRKHLQVEPLNKDFRAGWTSIAFQLKDAELKGLIDNKVELVGPCVKKPLYRVCVSAQNCVAEVFDLRVFVG